MNDFKRSIVDNAVINNIVNQSRNADGTVNINQAISIARAKGYSTLEDQVKIINLANIINKDINDYKGTKYDK